MMIKRTWITTLFFAVFLATVTTQKASSDDVNTVISNSPRFIVNLPGDNLLCVAIDGFELFTFNLITSGYVVVNGFLNLTKASHVDQSLYTNSTDTRVYLRGFTDLGVLVKAIDTRWKGGKRIFKHTVNGGKMKATLDGFGEMDIHKGSVTFAIDKGHSNIESQAAKFETFKVMMDKPTLRLTAVSDDQRTFNVYIENPSGLSTISIHGLIGQFYSHKVRLNTFKKELTRADGVSIPLTEGPLWDTVRDDVFAGRQCWYPEEGYKAIEGEPWEYVVEHLLATSFKRTLYKH